MLRSSTCIPLGLGSSSMFGPMPCYQYRPQRLGPMRLMRRAEGTSGLRMPLISQPLGTIGAMPDNDSAGATYQAKQQQLQDGQIASSEMLCSMQPAETHTPGSWWRTAMFTGRVGLLMLTVFFSTSLGAKPAFAKRVEPEVAVRTTTTRTETVTKREPTGFNVGAVRESLENLWTHGSTYSPDKFKTDVESGQQHFSNYSVDTFKSDLQKPKIYLPLGAVLLLIFISVASKGGSDAATSKPVAAAKSAAGTVKHAASSAAGTVAAAGSATAGAVKSAASTTKEAVKSAGHATADAAKSAASTVAATVTGKETSAAAAVDKSAAAVSKQSGGSQPTTLGGAPAAPSESAVRVWPPPKSGQNFFGDASAEAMTGSVGVPAGVPGFGADERGSWRDLSVDENDIKISGLTSVDMPAAPGAWRNSPSLDEAEAENIRVGVVASAAAADSSRGEWRDQLYDPDESDQRSVGAVGGGGTVSAARVTPNTPFSGLSSSTSAGAPGVGRSLSASSAPGARSRTVVAGSAAAAAAPTAPGWRSQPPSSPSSPSSGGAGGVASGIDDFGLSIPPNAAVWPPKPASGRPGSAQQFRPQADSPYSSGAAAAARAILHPSIASSDAIDSGADAIARAIRESEKGPVKREEPVPRPPPAGSSSAKSGPGADLKIAYNPDAQYVPQADSNDTKGAAAIARKMLHPSVDGGEVDGGAEKVAKSILHPTDEQDPGFKTGGGDRSGPTQSSTPQSGCSSDSSSGGGGGGGSSGSSNATEPKSDASAAKSSGSPGGAFDLKIAYNPDAKYVPQADSGDAAGAAAVARAMLHPSIDGGEADGGAKKVAQSILHPTDEQDPGFESGGGSAPKKSPPSGGGGSGGGSSSPPSNRGGGSAPTSSPPSSHSRGGGGSGSGNSGESGGGGSSSATRSKAQASNETQGQAAKGPEYSIAHPSQERSQVNVSSSGNTGSRNESSDKNQGESKGQAAQQQEGKGSATQQSDAKRPLSPYTIKEQGENVQTSKAAKGPEHSIAHPSQEHSQVNINSGGSSGSSQGRGKAATESTGQATKQAEQATKQPERKEQPKQQAEPKWQSGKGPEHSIAHPSQEHSQVNINNSGSGGSTQNMGQVATKSAGQASKQPEQQEQGQSPWKSSKGPEHSIAHPSQEHSQVNVSASAGSSSRAATATAPAPAKQERSRRSDPARKSFSSPENLRDGSVFFSYDVLSIDEEELDAFIVELKDKSGVTTTSADSKNSADQDDSRGGGGGSNGGSSLPQAPSPLSSVSRSEVGVNSNSSSSNYTTVGNSSSSSSTTNSSNTSSSASSATGKRGSGKGNKGNNDAHPVAYAAAISISAAEGLGAFGRFLFSDVAPAMGKVLQARSKTVPPADSSTTNTGGANPQQFALLLGVGVSMVLSHNTLLA